MWSFQSQARSAGAAIAHCTVCRLFTSVATFDWQTLRTHSRSRPLRCSTLVSHRGCLNHGSSPGTAVHATFALKNLLELEAWAYVVPLSCIRDILVFTELAMKAETEMANCLETSLKVVRYCFKTDRPLPQQNSGLLEGITCAMKILGEEETLMETACELVFLLSQMKNTEDLLSRGLDAGAFNTIFDTADKYNENKKIFQCGMKTAFILGDVRLERERNEQERNSSDSLASY